MSFSHFQFCHLSLLNFFVLLLCLRQNLKPYTLKKKDLNPKDLEGEVKFIVTFHLFSFHVEAVVKEKAKPSQKGANYF